MADSFISPADKVILADVFNNIHATFARPITMFKTDHEVVINSNPENNFLYPGAPGNDVTASIIQSGVFMARIKYNTKEEQNNFGTNKNDQLISQREDGEVRIKLDPTGAQYLNNATRVRFDGDIFSISTSQRPHGLFVPNFYTFWLRKDN